MLSACNKPAPQLPANKPTANDSAGLTMMQVNEKLIIAEDSLINEYVSCADSSFVKYKSGFWYKMNSSTTNRIVKPNEICKVNYSVYSLEKKLLFTKIEKVQVGKRQIIRAIDEMLLLMHHGEKSTLVIPWYLAYGLKGDLKTISPYTSVVVYLYLYPVILHN